MSHTLRCNQGHQWELADRDPAPGSATNANCPVCGNIAETLAPPVAGRTFAAADQASHWAFDARSTDGAGADATLTSPPPMSFRATPDPEALPTIPGYEVLKELGRGGMGAVYLASQASLDRLVAIKLLTAGSRQRFRTEAEAIARLQHPNIVQIFEVGEAQGQPYFAQEYIPSGSLADRLDGTPWPPRKTAEIVAALAVAVQYSHERHVVHRDLKPANILMAQDDAPKISDFGLAKKLDDASGETATGDIMGSPSYMAPEQASGATNEIGPAADIYSLGAILYELLCGRPPFRGQTPMETVYQVVSNEPVPPARLQPKLPRDLETICLKCLEKQPGGRYSSAHELADDLRRFLAGEPIRARPIGALSRAAKWSRRRPGAATAIGIAAASALAMLIGGTIYNIRLNAALSAAQLEQQRRTAILGQAQELVDRLVSDFGEGELASLPHSELARRRLLDSALAFCRDMQAQNPDAPELRWQIGRAQRQAADLQSLLGERDAARESYADAIAILQALVDEHPDPKFEREWAGAQLNLGNLHAQFGQPAEAEQTYRQAVETFDRLYAAEPTNSDRRRQLARALDRLGTLLVGDGRLDEASVPLRRSLESKQALLAEDPSNREARQSLATTLNNFGLLERELGNFSAAERSFANAQELFQSLGKEFPGVAEFRLGLATACANRAVEQSRARQFEAARETFGQSLSLLTTTVDDFPAVEEYRAQLARTLLNYGLALEECGQFDQAKEHYGQARQHYEVLLGNKGGEPSHRLGLALCAHRQGAVATSQRRFEDADDALSQAIDSIKTLIEEASASAESVSALSLAYHSAGDLMLAQQEPSKARHYLSLAVDEGKRAVELRPKQQELKRRLRRHYASLAQVELDLGELTHAAQLADELAAISTGDGQSLRDAALVFAQCIPLVDRFKANVPGDFGENCGAKSVKLLRAAAAAGDGQIASMLETAASEPLRQRSDFQALREELHGPAPTTDGSK